ncbi:hypothetical protein LAD68_02615 [Mycoplasma sp. 229/8]|nr:hypothetical protein [Mycoplasma tauri]MBZ4226739.1 hypothetical protein [Mycoplasma tauri]
MLKLPTFKDLKMNIKALLWKYKPDTFKDFQNKYQRQFCKSLGAYLIRNKLHTSDNFNEIYQIIFYYGFINYKREQELYDFLTSKGFTVKVSNIKNDAIHGIDLIAVKNDIKMYIQVKPNNDLKESKNIIKLSRINGFLPVLCYKNSNKKWIFFNIFMKTEMLLF